ncbi:hypothetical protein RRG08_065750 [Elysia crispata]|uniref:Uncharacterized protein n=1 Tax=Elysia crispata TaxID=231223 RepID=A0AAE1DAY5_9GAST|nr:hypothetical protein RRG08_065750 [Elysia crispata]
MKFGSDKHILGRGSPYCLTPPKSEEFENQIQGVGTGTLPGPVRRIKAESKTNLTNDYGVRARISNPVSWVKCFTPWPLYFFLLYVA